MRLATYNVEWFDALFDQNGELLADDNWSARHDVTRAQQLEALGIVFTAMDADGIMVIEAPDSNRRRDGVVALENFARTFNIRARKAVIGFVNDTQQEIAFLYDPDRMNARHDPVDGDAYAPRFDGEFRIDLDIDRRTDRVVFSKPPLELALEPKGGAPMRVIGAHLKSKAPHGARGHDEIMRLAIANRRKQLAQAIWLRRRIEMHLAAGDSVALMGDLNDGPGLDRYEGLFGRSSVEIVLGTAPGETALLEPHARRALESKIGARPTTARFYLKDEERYLQALLDYIMLSPDLAVREPRWRIWHPFDDPACWRIQELRDALLAASDHFPVTVDLAD